MYLRLQQMQLDGPLSEEYEFSKSWDEWSRYMTRRFIASCEVYTWRHIAYCDQYFFWGGGASMRLTQNEMVAFWCPNTLKERLSE